MVKRKGDGNVNGKKVPEVDDYEIVIDDYSTKNGRQRTTFNLGFRQLVLHETAKNWQPHPYVEIFNSQPVFAVMELRKTIKSRETEADKAVKFREFLYDEQGRRLIATNSLTWLKDVIGHDVLLVQDDILGEAIVRDLGSVPRHKSLSKERFWAKIEPIMRSESLVACYQVQSKEGLWGVLDLNLQVIAEPVYLKMTENRRILRDTVVLSAVNQVTGKTDLYRIALTQ